MDKNILNGIEERAKKLLLEDLAKDFEGTSKRVITSGFCIYVFQGNTRFDGQRLETPEIQKISCNLYFAYMEFLQERANKITKNHIEESMEFIEKHGE